ncbi:MAG: MarR family transcriptional regulator [Acidobacteria bacterium]|nr:MAG: MarR family transcriptional regulator [Acidobacteriota bacterium]PYY02362.1 MAG: MarR family transcriptional regulator [Acidobacteriota bacterium]PYY22513.1 MAG: MarR family transcriptional regulator [Acidobacteriota bacterium]
MPRKQSETLTQAELRLMNVLWSKGPATVQQVLDWLATDYDLAYNSVLTTIRILENKGYLKHTKDGRAHIYRPVIARDEASRSEVRHLVSRFFGNSHHSLLLNLLQEQELNAEEIKQLRQILEASERK